MDLASFAVRSTAWATNAARTLVAQLRGAGAEGDDVNAEPADGAEVVQPMGLRVRPVQPTPGQPSHLEAFCFERGDETVAVFLLDKTRVTGAVETEAGGATLYAPGNQSAVVYIRSSGDIEITPAAGRNVILNGGSTPAAKEGSATTGHTHTISGTAGPYPIVATAATMTDTIATGAGSPTVKVP